MFGTFSKNGREEYATRNALPFSDLLNDRNEFSVDDVGIASNDVPVVEDSLRERLAGRVRPQVSREGGRLEDRQVRVNDEQRGARRCSSEVFPRRLMILQMPPTLVSGTGSPRRRRAQEASMHL